MIPKKITKKSRAMVISPARSLAILSKETREIADKRFEEMGLQISFSKNAEECNEFNSSSKESRLEDIHSAFAERSVGLAITTIGGFNSNELVKDIDYELIKKNPKILCGYSDITILLNAIFAKTGLVTYHGPHYSSFGEKKALGILWNTLKNACLKKSLLK